MKIRRYRPSDCKQTAMLFFQAVHAIPNSFYTERQKHAWAPAKMDLKAWNRSLLKSYTLVALRGKTIVGFADIHANGHLDHLFVHALYPREGIATVLCDRLEAHCRQPRLTTHASLYAKTFFCARGYRVVHAQCVHRRGESLKNYIMEKIR